MSSTNRTILVVGDHHKYRHEGLASGTIKPGYACEMTSATAKTFQAQSVRGGKGRRLFALENAYLGGVISGLLSDGSTTYYANGERMFVHEAQKGDKINVVLMTGESVTKGDWLIPYGNGRMCKAAAAYLANAAAASTALSNTITETAFSNGSVSIPANTLKVGDVIRVKSQGIATATNSTDTLTVKPYLGATELATTGAVDVANNDIWDIDLTIVIRTIGASGTYVVTGSVSLGAAGTVTKKAVYVASTAIDTTAAITLAVKGTWSVASASNSCRQDVFTVEHVKGGTSAPTVPAGGEVWGQADETIDATSADKHCCMVVI